MIDLSVVVVSWNVKALLQRCLVSVIESSMAGVLQCQVIVVDNASVDGSQDMVRQHFPTVELIASGTNLGFTGGNNVGIAKSTGRHILLLNPDTEVIGGALSTMVGYMDHHPDVGALGPKVVFPDGRVQTSRRRFPTLATAFLESTVLQQWWPRNRVLARYYVADASDEQEQDVDWVVGACLLIRRETWDQVGPLDEALFMYSEELDWCRRAKGAGWRVVYMPHAVIVHHEGQSSIQDVPARHIYFQSSKVYYFRKHHGVLPAECLRAFLLATYVCQLLMESGKWLAGHKRSLRRERVAAYLRVLRSGLRAHSQAASLQSQPSGEDR